MDYAEIESRIRSCELTCAKAEALANKALETSQQGLVKQTENEARLKSIQHRVDHTEGKMDTMLDWISRIDNKLTHNNSVQEGIRRTMKVFMGVVSVASLGVGIIRVVMELSRL